MWSMTMVTFREGIEAFLIAAITLTYIDRTGRRTWLPWAWAGIAVAVVLSVSLGIALVSAGGMTPLAEGWLALVAAVLVLTCTVHLMRQGPRLAADIRARIDRADTGSRYAPLAIFVFLVLMIGREGVEAATMIAALAVAGDMQHLLLGAVIGVAAATVLALAWVRYGRRVDLALFFRVTAVFMVLFSIQLIVYAFHEFTEAEALPFVDNEFWHVATEPYGPEGAFGQWLSYSLVAVPLAYLAVALLRRRSTTSPSPAPH